MLFNKPTKLSIAAAFVCLTMWFAICLPVAVLAQTNAEKNALAKRTFNEGMTLFDRQTPESYQAAREKFLAASRLYRETGNESGEVQSIIWAAYISDKLDEKRKALEYYEQVLPRLRIVSDEQWKATTLVNAGLVYSDVGEKQKALVYFNQALPISRRINDKNGEAVTLNNIGLAYSDLDEKEKALDYYNQSLVLYRQTGNERGEALTLSNIGLVYDDLGEKQKALDYYNQSIQITRRIGYKEQEALTLSTIGKIYSDLGEKQKALFYFNQSLPILREVRDKRGEVGSLTGIGKIYSDLGEKQKSLDYYNQALPLARATDDKAQEAAALIGIGVVYFTLNDKLKALIYFKQALPLVRQIEDKVGETVTLNNIGLIYAESGEMENAIVHFKQALEIARRVGHKEGEAVTLGNLGRFYDAAGEGRKALEYLEQALTLDRANGDKNKEGRTLTNIGAAYDNLGEKEKALQYFQDSLSVSRVVGDKSSVANTLDWLMGYWKRANNSRFAVFYGKKSVNIYQVLRSNAMGLDKNLQKSFLKSVEYEYRSLADLLIKQNRLAEAQQVLNSFKDQQYFDFSQNTRLAMLALTKREAETDLILDQKLEAITAAVRTLDDFKRAIGTRLPTAEEAVKIKRLEADMKMANDEYNAFLKFAEREFAAKPDENDKIPAVADLLQMQAALRQVSADTEQKTIAVYQLVGVEDFSLIVVAADKITSVSVPIKSEILNEKAKQLWALLQTDGYDTTKLSKQIYDVVFAPLEAKLPKDTTTIMWSLDGNLRYVPMAALFDGERFLVERYSHAVFTRADQERMTRQVSPVWTGTGFGSSEAATVEVLGNEVSFVSLPGVREELSAIFKNEKGGILDGATFSDTKFSRKNFLDAMKKKRPLVHIASHFSFRPGDEARSFLLLGDGTAFTLEEMKRETNLFEGVELLTLSACNTAAQQPGADGREIDGFAELAQRLGAGAVMATLWQVSDASTPWLMRDFYMKRENKTSKAAALRDTQIGLLGGTAEVKNLELKRKGFSTSDVEIVITPEGKRDGDTRSGTRMVIAAKDAPPYKKDKKKPFAHPFYWSPFVLIGNWK